MAYWIEYIYGKVNFEKIKINVSKLWRLSLLSFPFLDNACIGISIIRGGSIISAAKASDWVTPYGCSLHGVSHFGDSLRELVNLCGDGYCPIGFPSQNISQSFLRYFGNGVEQKGQVLI